MTTSIGSFIDTLRESRLLEPARLDELLRTPDAQEVDAPTLGQCLVQLGWLTNYQVEELLQGRPTTLIVGSYRVLERLGQDTLGPAFKARHPEKEGRFVVKLIEPEKLAGDGVRQRFLQEARTAAQLAHPNVARVAEPETQGDRVVYIREYVEGVDLETLVRQHGPLPVGYACDYIHQAAQGLQHVHERGLVHGHIQAPNLVVAYSTTLVGAAAGDENHSAGLPAPGAVVKLVDCGLGALHSSAKPSIQQDIADLGNTFSFLLTSIAADGQPPAPLPAGVEEVRRRLRSENPAERYNSAAEVVQAIAPLCGTEPPVDVAATPMLDLNAPAPAEAAPALELPATPAPAEIPTALPPVAETPRALPPLPPPPPPPGAGAAPAWTPPAAYAKTPTAAPITAEAPVEQPPTQEAAAPPVKPGRKQWTTRDWVLVAVGLILHLFAAAIIVILVMNYLNSNKGSSPTRRQTAPTKTAPTKTKAELRHTWVAG